MSDTLQRLQTVRDFHAGFAVANISADLLNEAIAALAERDALAARYRWLSTHESVLPDLYQGAELDAAIDAAIAQEPKS